MKTAMRFDGRWLGMLMVGVLTVLTGCQTTPPIDWAGRVGVFSYDDAVLEMGPPDKMTLISTGRVAEWLESRRTSPRFSFGVGGFGGSGYSGAGVGVGTGTGGNILEDFLRLTFDQEDKLVRWETVKH